MNASQPSSNQTLQCFSIQEHKVEHKISTVTHCVTITRNVNNPNPFFERTYSTFFNEGLQWILIMYSQPYQGVSGRSKIFIILQLVSAEVQEVLITSKLTVIDGVCQSQNIMKCFGTFQVIKMVEIGRAYRYDTFDYSTDEYKSDKLTLVAEINILKCFGVPQRAITVPKCTLQSELEEAIDFKGEKMRGVDVTLVVYNEPGVADGGCDGNGEVKKCSGSSSGSGDGACNIKVEVGSDSSEDVQPMQRFNVHKFMLAARSPVFARMFEHDMQESVTNEVKISDIQPLVIKEMLTFIYTDKAPNLKHMSFSLLYVAEKYQLKRLKALCERELTNTINCSNAAETLAHAYTHNAQQLKKVALNFVAENGGQILKTKGWEKVKECGADLVTEVMDVIYNSPYLDPPAAKKTRLA